MHITACSCWRTTSRFWVAVIVAAAIAATAAAASAQHDGPRTECSSSAAARFNFFPDNTKNLPEGWSQQNQRRAGNMCKGQLLPIALYGAPKPRLHFRPEHDLLKAGAVFDVRQWDAAAGHQPQRLNGSSSQNATSTEKDQVFSIASFNDHTGIRAWSASKQTKPSKPFLGGLSSSKPQKPPFGSEPLKPLFGNGLLPKLKGKQPFSAEARSKALSTFIQVLLTGSTPDEIEVAAAKDSAAPAAAVATAAGVGRPQPLRAVSVDRGDGSVEHYTTRGDRILLEMEADLSSYASDADNMDAVNFLDSSSSSSSSSRVHDGAGAAAVHERGNAQGNLEAFGSRSVSGGLNFRTQDTAPGQARRGGLLQMPWDKPRSSQGPTAAGSNRRQNAGLAGLFPGLVKQATVAAPVNSSNATVVAPWTVLSPAKYLYSVQVNGRPWYTSTVHANAQIAMLDFQGNETAGRRDLFDPVIFREGINTLVINVTFISNSSVLGNGTHNMTGPPANETFSSPEIDFYFFMWGNATHDSRPSAVVQFESCKYETAIRFSNARPTPVLIDGYRLTDRPIPDRTTAFFLPVYHVYGQFEKGLDGSTDLRTDNTEGNIKNFGLYLTRLPGSPQNFTFSGPQLDALKEGWWQFTVEGSLWVPLPHLAHLLSLSGIDRYGNTDVLYRQVQPGGKVTDGMSLLNSVKGAGWVLPEYTSMHVGLQRSVTALDYFEGPSAPLVLGDKALFDWHWTGLDSGLTQCKIEGKGTVSMAGNCSSPLTYTVRTNLNQTLTVLYTDVCEKHHNASLTFGPSFGWAVEAKESGQGSLQLVGSGSSREATSLQKNSGSARRTPGAARALLQILLAAAVSVAVSIMWM